MKWLTSEEHYVWILCYMAYMKDNLRTEVSILNKIQNIFIQQQIF